MVANEAEAWTMSEHYIISHFVEHQGSLGLSSS